MLLPPIVTGPELIVTPPALVPLIGPARSAPPPPLPLIVSVVLPRLSEPPIVSGATELLIHVCELVNCSGATIEIAPLPASSSMPVALLPLIVVELSESVAAPPIEIPFASSEPNHRPPIASGEFRNGELE